MWTPSEVWVVGVLAAMGGAVLGGLVGLLLAMGAQNDELRDAQSELKRLRAWRDYE